MEWNAITIKQLRFQLGLTQASLAAEIGVALHTVQRWERGRSRPLPIYRPILTALKEKHDGNR